MHCPYATRPEPDTPHLAGTSLTDWPPRPTDRPGPSRPSVSCPSAPNTDNPIPRRAHTTPFRQAKPTPWHPRPFPTSRPAQSHPDDTPRRHTPHPHSPTQTRLSAPCQPTHTHTDKPPPALPTCHNQPAHGLPTTTRSGPSRPTTQYPPTRSRQPVARPNSLDAGHTRLPLPSPITPSPTIQLTAAPLHAFPSQTSQPTAQATRPFTTGQLPRHVTSALPDPLATSQPIPFRTNTPQRRLDVPSPTGPEPTRPSSPRRARPNPTSHAFASPRPINPTQSDLPSRDATRHPARQAGALPILPDTVRLAMPCRATKPTRSRLAAPCQHPRHPAHTRQSTFTPRPGHPVPTSQPKPNPNTTSQHSTGHHNPPPCRLRAPLHSQPNPTDGPSPAQFSAAPRQHRRPGSHLLASHSQRRRPIATQLSSRHAPTRHARSASRRRRTNPGLSRLASTSRAATTLPTDFPPRSDPVPPRHADPGPGRSPPSRYRLSTPDRSIP